MSYEEEQRAAQHRILYCSSWLSEPKPYGCLNPVLNTVLYCFHHNPLSFVFLAQWSRVGASWRVWTSRGLASAYRYSERHDAGAVWLMRM